MSDSVLKYVWAFTAAPVLLAMVLAIREALKRLGIDVTQALLWPFLRRVRQSVSSTVNLRRYCRLSLASPETAFFQVPGANDSTAMKVDDLFVRLRLDAVSNTEASFTNESILKSGNRIRVVGDPGSGKSSLVKSLFRDLCRKAMASPRAARVPIIIELKNLVVPQGEMCDDELGPWALEQIKNSVARMEGHKMDEFFDLVVRQNGIVLLLDGLDEVSSTAYESVGRMVRMLSRRLSSLSENNIVVLTMRVQFHQQVRRDFDRDFPVTLHVKPFSAGDIYDFLSKWFSGRDALRNATRVYGELADRPSLRDMCRNPLILAMYTVNYRSSANADLPDTRTEFYKAVVDELLIKRRSRQTSNRAGRVARREDRYTILGRLALENLLDFDQPANSISWNRAVAVTREVLKIQTDERAVESLVELAKETGIFSVERPDESIRFIHLTFCEFLAATEAMVDGDDGWKRLLDVQKTPRLAANSPAAHRLHEVIPFAVAMTARRKRDAILGEIWRAGNADLYVKCILETQQYDHASWVNYVKEEREWLAGRDHSEWDGYWLARLHLYQTSLLESAILRRSEDGQVDNGSVVLDRLFTDLVSEKKDRLLRLFSAYASENPRGAFKLAEVCGVDLLNDVPELLIEEASNPPFLAVCIDLAASDKEQCAKWAAVLSEAGMKSAIAASILDNEEVLSSWAHLLSSVPRRHRWWNLSSRRKARATAYNSAISITLWSIERDVIRPAGLAGRINRLSAIKSPGRLIPAPVVFTACVMSFFAIMFARKIFTGGKSPEDTSVMEFLASLLFIYTALIPVLVGMYAIRRRKCYLSVINLNSMAHELYGFRNSRSFVRSFFSPLYLPYRLVAPRLSALMRHIAREGRDVAESDTGR